ncbi:MAG: DMT family transporter [Caldicoprobacterales bacterium]|jgi:drug/metabolite transporter (DMT)-like permease|nr:DMT family transporter [Clostridiales bacterium]
MRKMEWKASILLTLAAVIWGFAFVAQRVGIQYIGSFTFTGVRFALGAFSLLPLIIRNKRKAEAAMQGVSEKADRKAAEIKSEGLVVLRVGMTAGLILFIAASLQQIGLVETTAGKAAFITGFYIILVPALGIFLKQAVGAKTWIAAVLAIAGLYLISVEENFNISQGDFLIFLCSFFFAAHILLINKFTRKVDTLKLSFVQYLVCSVLSLVTALFVEEIHLDGIFKAAVPILYGGVFSVGIAYTLQVVGQKYARASHAAIIMSLESVFALIGGMLILQETMNWKGYAGCLFMLAGVLLSQLQGKERTKANKAGREDSKMNGRLSPRTKKPSVMQ